MNVNRWALTTLALLFVVLFSATPASPQPLDVEEGIREVVVWNGQTSRFLRIGTAFHVGSGVFYTNAHVVKAKVPDGFTDWYLASKTSTRSVSSWLGPFAVACVHPRWRDPGDSTKSHPYDVAQVKLAALPDLPAFTFSERSPMVGQRVTIKGFPGASRAWPPILYTSTGRVSRIWGPEHVFGIDVESGFTVGGTSGSPVFAEDGRVLGIVYTKTTPPNTIQLAILTSAALEGCPG